MSIESRADQRVRHMMATYGSYRELYAEIVHALRHWYLPIGKYTIVKCEIPTAQQLAAVGTAQKRPHRMVTIVL